MIGCRAALLCYYDNPSGVPRVEVTHWRDVDEARHADAALSPCGPRCQLNHTVVAINPEPSSQPPSRHLDRSPA